ncbi:hypothetical protein [Microbulbifer discodermiae]|uniref:hypothetical protein n=1 Tax=Microbulbifer sp. 2201CG32-9 TaxID=3232309 RepID=UPI00345B7D4F
MSMIGSNRNKLKQLKVKLLSGDSAGIEALIFELGSSKAGYSVIPEEIFEGILEILDTNEHLDSQLWAHVLNIFEFESECLSNKQKGRIKSWLKENGKKYTHIHTVQVVSELLNDNYLQ